MCSLTFGSGRSRKDPFGLVFSSTAAADLVEYPDSNKIAAMGGGFRAPGAVSYMLSTAEQLGYFDGEAEEEPTR
jgi:hypothetical protein